MKYVIPSGRPFYCEFQIKEPGESMPMDVTGASGTFTLSEIGHNPCLVLSAPIEVVDNQNGVVSISLTALQTMNLEGRRGLPEDGYLLMPTYAGALDMMIPDPDPVGLPDVPVNVFIPKVYIQEVGEVCPAKV